MSFREKSAWIMGALMIAAGLYYLDMAVAASRAAGGMPPTVAIFVPFTTFVITASIVIQIAIAIVAPNDADAPADERERPLLDRAGNWSGLVLGGCAVGSLMHFLIHENGVMLFHAIMASLIVSQIAEYAFQIWLFRRAS